MKKIPKFKNENDEREFWSKNDSIDYVDWSKAEVNPVFPNLKPSTKSISIRLPESMINRLKMKANERDVPYQSLVKLILSKELKKI